MCVYVFECVCEHECQGIYMGVVEVRGSCQVALIALSTLLRQARPKACGSG